MAYNMNNDELALNMGGAPSADMMKTAVANHTEFSATKIEGEPPLLNQEYLQHLRSLGPFPKKLHILFPHKDYYKQHSDMDFVKHGILRFMYMNPSWNVTIYDNDMMDDIIRQAASDGIISLEEMVELVGNDTQPAAHRELLLFFSYDYLR